MPATYFDDLLAPADDALGAIFDADYGYRVLGRGFALRARLSAQASRASIDGQISESWHSHTFALTAADLVLDGEPFEPEAGHQITAANGDGTLAVYEVVKQPQNRCFVPLDAAGHKLLVFCNLIRRAEKA